MTAAFQECTFRADTISYLMTAGAVSPAGERACRQAATLSPPAPAKEPASLPQPTPWNDAAPPEQDRKDVQS